MPDDSQSGYGFLAQRAWQFLCEQDGAVDEDTLIRHVFSALPGQSAARLNVEIWRGVLPSVLSDRSRFQALGGRMWARAGAHEPTAIALGDEFTSLEYIVLDTETTGLKASSNHIIEVSALHYRPDCDDDAPAAVYSSLTNPSTRLPAFIVSHTGISQSMVNDAPSFAQIAFDLRQFIGERVIIGHNIGFDIAFLNAEMQRLGQPPFINPRLDTLALAVRLIKDLTKPNLSRVAATLGLPVGLRHRAEADARLTRAVFCRLLALARQRGVQTLATLQELAKPLGAEYWRRGEQRGSRFDPKAWQWSSDPLVATSEVTPRGNSWLREIPEGAGVYIMRDANHNALYVGKAGNLRRRVSSYYGRDEGVLRGLVGLREATAKLELRLVGSELAATLLELELIAELQPGYNTQRQAAAPRQYIRLHQPKRGLPTLEPAAAPGETSFGPYPSRSEVDDLLHLLRAIFPAIVSPRATDEYHTQLAEALAYLRGDDEPALVHLRARLHHATAAHDYAAETEARQLIAALLRRRERPAPASAVNDAIIVLPAMDDDTREVLLVREGWLGWRGPIPADAVEDVLTARLAELWAQAAPAPLAQPALLPDVPPPLPRPDPASSLVLRWLFAHPDHPAVIAIPTEREAAQDALRRAARLILAPPLRENLGILDFRFWIGDIIGVGRIAYAQPLPAGGESSLRLRLPTAPACGILAGKCRVAAVA